MATPIYLITDADFAPYIDLPSNMRGQKINQRILEAQNFDLCGLMGADFYAYFLANRTAPENGTLLNGGDYSRTISGTAIPYTFDGLKPVLVCFAAARIIAGNDVQIAPFGNVYKNNEFSDRANINESGKLATQYENRAKAYWVKCQEYIMFKGREVFPLYNGFGCSVSPVWGAPRVIGITGRGNNGRR